MVYGATFRFDKTALIDELHAMAERIHQEWQQGKRLEPRPRILITGCPIGGAAEKVVRAIEENGGWVVGYENCTGAKATERCVAEEGDVYDALTDKYLAIGCSCISPNDQRLQLLSQMVEEYQADGVIDVICRPAIPMPWNRWRLNAICANSTIFLTWRLKPTIRQRTSASSAPASPPLSKCCKELA